MSSTSVPPTVPVYTRLSPADVRLLRRIAKQRRETPSQVLKKWVELELDRQRSASRAARNQRKGETG